MSMRNIAVAGAALALALGCEREEDRATTYETDTVQEPVTTGDPQAVRRERTDDGMDTRFEQAPERQQQQQQPGQQQHGQQQMGQQPGMAGQPGQVVSQLSDQNFARTISQLTREMRQNDLDVVAQIRYDRQTRQRALRQLQQRGEQAGQQRQQAGQQQQAGMGQQQQQAGMGQQQPGQQQAGTPGQMQQQEQIGDVRLIVFRHTNQEAHAVETQGAEALLQVPRELLVYERGEDVIVAYRTPPQMEAPGTAEPTSELLSRVVRSATQPEQQRQRAEAEQQEQQAQQQEQEQQARAEQQEQQAQAEQQRAEAEQQRAEAEQMEQEADERQARAEREME